MTTTRRHRTFHLRTCTDFDRLVKTSTVVSSLVSSPLSSLVSSLVSSPLSSLLSPLDLSSLLSSLLSSDCGQFSTCPGRYVVLRNTGCAFWFAVSLVACSGGMDPLAASSPLDRSFATPCHPSFARSAPTARLVWSARDGVSAVVSAPARALLSAPPRVTCGNRMRWLHWRLHFGASRLQVTVARSWRGHYDCV